MKLLWLKTGFLHPTSSGGQIRTLEMLRCLHKRHEIHYVAFNTPGEPEGVARSGEYCTRAYPVELRIPPKASVRFQVQVLRSVFEAVPLTISRYRSVTMRRQIDALIASGQFDRVICDFLTPAINLSSMHGVVLFQHNVESIIWQRRAAQAKHLIDRLYLHLQADRMIKYEEKVCRAAAHVVAVSAADANVMHNLFDLKAVSHISTGVDLNYFSSSNDRSSTSDLVFIGSMDWAPNIDGILFFVREILPLIWRKRPQCKLTIVGRQPKDEILKLPRSDPRIVVTGTVKDIRPYLFGSMVSIVPLRIGGGTRLKIYEAMAAKVPTISTTVGAEGLVARHPDEIRIADSPAEFAENCLELLSDAPTRARIANAGWDLVNSRFSWDEVTLDFEKQLIERGADRGSDL
jgi:glycosyltransferase involved in cell wall biosynthesis